MPYKTTKTTTTTSSTKRKMKPKTTVYQNTTRIMSINLDFCVYEFDVSYKKRKVFLFIVSRRVARSRRLREKVNKIKKWSKEGTELNRRQNKKTQSPYTTHKVMRAAIYIFHVAVARHCGTGGRQHTHTHTAANWTEWVRASRVSLCEGIEIELLVHCCSHCWTII